MRRWRNGKRTGLAHPNIPTVSNTVKNLCWSSVVRRPVGLPTTHLEARRRIRPADPHEPALARSCVAATTLAVTLRSGVPAQPHACPPRRVPWRGGVHHRRPPLVLDRARCAETRTCHDQPAPASQRARCSRPRGRGGARPRPGSLHAVEALRGRSLRYRQARVHRTDRGARRAAAGLVRDLHARPRPVRHRRARTSVRSRSCAPVCTACGRSIRTCACACSPRPSRCRRSRTS